MSMPDSGAPRPRSWLPWTVRDFTVHLPSGIAVFMVIGTGYAIITQHNASWMLQRIGWMLAVLMGPAAVFTGVLLIAALIITVSAWVGAVTVRLVNRARRPDRDPG